MEGAGLGAGLDAGLDAGVGVRSDGGGRITVCLGFVVGVTGESYDEKKEDVKT